MNSDKKPKRRINPDHLAVVLLAALGLVFVLTIILANVIPKNTTPSELTIAEETAEAKTEQKSSGKSALSYDADNSNTQKSENSTTASDDIDKSAVLSLIDSDLSDQIDNWKTGVLQEDDLSYTKNSDELTVRGSYKTYSFTYVLEQNADGYDIISLNISNSQKDDSNTDDKQGDSTSTDLPLLGTYDVNINSTLHIGAQLTDGELRVDAVDDNGKVQTVFDEKGPYNNDDFQAELTSGHYQINLYGNPSDWSFSYSAD